MTDKQEQKLLKEYNKAIDALQKIPLGDPRHIPASARMIAAHRALKRYWQIQQARAKKDQN